MGAIASSPLDILRSYGLTLPEKLVAPQAIAATNNDVSRQLIEIYVESLCPFCQKFFETQLRPIVNDEILDYFDISVIPFGNASWDTITNEPNCQHGKNECYFNVVQQAIVELYPQHTQQTERLQRYLCIEDVIKSNNIESGSEYDEVAFQSYWKPCFEDEPDTLQDVEDIVSNELEQWNKSIVEGTLFEKYQTKTSLVSDRKFVPWLLIDGTYDEALQKDLKNELCNLLERNDDIESKNVC